MYCQTDSLSRQKQCHLRKKVILMKLEFRSGRLVIDVRTVLVIQSISVSVCRDSPWTSEHPNMAITTSRGPPCKTVAHHNLNCHNIFLSLCLIFASPHVHPRMDENRRIAWGTTSSSRVITY